MHLLVLQPNVCAHLCFAAPSSYDCKTSVIIIQSFEAHGFSMIYIMQVVHFSVHFGDIGWAVWNYLSPTASLLYGALQKLTANSSQSDLWLCRKSNLSSLHKSPFCKVKSNWCSVLRPLTSLVHSDHDCALSPWHQFFFPSASSFSDECWQHHRRIGQCWVRRQGIRTSR